MDAQTSGAEVGPRLALTQTAPCLPASQALGTPEGMTAASERGADNAITPALGLVAFPLARDCRLAGSRVKDACGAAKGGRAKGPVL